MTITFFPHREHATNGCLCFRLNFVHVFFVNRIDHFMARRYFKKYIKQKQSRSFITLKEHVIRETTWKQLN